MSKTIDEMDAAELRDELARAAGWRKTGRYGGDEWYHEVRNLVNTHPIPALDTPKALGVIAGMMPEGWTPIIEGGREWRASAVPPNPEWGGILNRCINMTEAIGHTEAIARARLTLKVLATQKPASSPTSAP